jgi:hypothetical protein
MTGPEVIVDGAVVPPVGSIIPAKVVVAHHVASIVVLMIYGGVFVWFMIYTTLWFTHIPSADQTPTVTAWIGGTQTMMAGLAGLMFKFYTDSQFGDHR